jgi:hypothetical protein
MLKNSDTGNNNTVIFDAPRQASPFAVELTHTSSTSLSVGFWSRCRKELMLDFMIVVKIPNVTYAV